jgi:hypothetical protein
LSNFSVEVYHAPPWLPPSKIIGQSERKGGRIDRTLLRMLRLGLKPPNKRLEWWAMKDLNF